MSAKKESPLAKGIEMMTIRTNRSPGRIIIALVSRLNYAILEYSRQPEPMADSPRSIDFDPTDFILLLGFGTFFFFLLFFMSVSFSPFSHVVLLWIWKYLSGIRSSAIYNNRGNKRERGKSESRKEEGNASNFSPSIKKEKQEKPQI